MNTAIVEGSIQSVANRHHKSLAESFLDVSTVIVCDCSSSMDNADSRGGRRRIDVAREELARLQAERPGKLALVCFGDHAQVMPGGVPPEPDGSTNLVAALKLAHKWDRLGIAFVVLSDGYPDEPNEAIKQAKQFASPISTVHCGPEDDKKGRDFLRRLAAAAGGQHTTAALVLNLADAVRPLLAQ